MKLLVLLLFLGSFSCFGQDSTETKTSLKLNFDWHHGCSCGSELSFPGGMTAFHKYLQENLNFTGIPRFNEQKLYVTFTITKHGDIENVIIHKIENKEVINEIERVFYHMPIWIPEQYNCKNVDTLARIPIVIDWKTN